ncbi:hypothetical protein G7Y89_g1976 [Cudoniella acicularis]|uniref:Uncharacterized protein n=1 Tax=Cudoniella acicularis TaxID=354080 RepID=A0A8H4RU97_9HELO|nr:hypothetical protein G7Y89_g1976 [Cudoniella acicularis]
MPSAESDGSPLPLLPFGCFFNEWFKYHDNEPNIEFGNFFANLVRIYPTAALLLERIDRGEAKEFLPNGGSPWRQPQNYNLKLTYRAIITIMDRYVDPGQERDSMMFINLEEHSKNQAVLLVRTGDESHLSAPINFEALRANGLCLPLARTDVPAASGDVVRVSLANAVKAPLETERKAKEWADELLKEADDKGIDNVSTTWSAVRRVKATRMGETFEKREPYPFNREKFNLHSHQRLCGGGGVVALSLGDSLLNDEFLVRYANIGK